MCNLFSLFSRGDSDSEQMVSLYYGGLHKKWFCGLTKSQGECLDNNMLEVEVERLRKKLFALFFPLMSSTLNHIVKSARHFKFHPSMPGLKSSALILGMNSNIHSGGFLLGGIIT